MADRRTCSACGVELTGNALSKLCVACLLKAGLPDAALDDDAPTKGVCAASFPLEEQAGTHIGRYKLLEKIGEGGCGVVYVAAQKQPVRRRVAVKVIKLGMDTRQVIARFEAERQALALMDHPNIAKVLDGGATESGRPFFVMELVKGIPITLYCDENQLDTQQRLELFIQICQAIQHAHQKGIIHRDIKPSNILVANHDGVPVPKVIDFGIAKATTDQPLTDKTLYTAIEQFIGTPAYMSPEQATRSGLDIDTRSDIYSLGVLLYELLTGHTPFEVQRLISAGLDEVRRIIREEEPPRPSRKLSTLNAKDRTEISRRRQCAPPKLLGLIQGDLDWILMKTLAKDRAQRYETAIGLAQDLQRHIQGEPVVARPPTTLYWIQKLLRRHKALFAAGALVMVALALGVTIAFWQYLERSVAYRELRVQKLRAEFEAKQARNQADIARAERKRADQQNRVAAKERELTQLHTVETLFRSDKASLGLALLAQALRQNVSNKVAAVRTITTLTDKNFLLPRLLRLESTRLATLDAAGQRLAHADTNNTLSIVDLDTGEFTAGPIIVTNLTIGLSFSPDGNYLLTFAGERFQLWDASRLTLVKTSKRVEKPIHSFAFTRAGARAIALANDGQVWVLDALDQTIVAGPLSEEWQDKPDILQFSPDGNCLLVVGDCPRLWDLSNTNRLLAFGYGRESAPRHAFSPDGRLLALAALGHNGAFIYDTRFPKAPPLMLDHGSHVRCMAFSPDGTLLATGGRDYVTRIWSARDGALVTDAIHHGGPILAVSFTPTGDAVLVHGADSTIRLWDARSGQPISEILYSNCDKMRVSPHGSTFLLESDCGAEVWDWSRGSQICEPARTHDAGVPRTTEILSPDESIALILTNYNNGAAREAIIVDWESHRRMSQVLTFENSILSARFSRDGQQIVVGIGESNMSGEGAAIVLESKTGRVLLPGLAHPDGPVLDATFDPTGQYIATGSDGGSCRVWDAKTGMPLIEPLVCESPVRQVAFVPNSEVLLVLCDSAKAWDWRLGTMKFQLRHSGSTSCMQISPNGRCFLTAGTDGAARIWDASTGRLIRDLPHNAIVHSASFNASGEQVITACADGATRFWDVSSGLPLTEPLMASSDSGIQRDVFSVRYIKSQERAEAELRGKTVLWDVPDFPSPAPTWLADLAEAVAGLRVDPEGQIVRMPSDTLFDLKRRLAASPKVRSDAYTNWAQWFFEDRSKRLISPRSGMTLSEYVNYQIALGTHNSLMEAKQLAYGNAGVLERISKASATAGLRFEFTQGELEQGVGSQGAVWKLSFAFDDDSGSIALRELKRNQEAVTLQTDNLLLEVPIFGGVSKRSRDNGTNWQTWFRMRRR